MSEPLPDVYNKFFIAGNGEKLVFLKPVPPQLSYDDALILAAWLVSMVGDDPRWEQILAAVQST